MHLPIEELYLESGWEVERLAVLPDDLSEIRHLSMRLGKPVCVANDATRRYFVIDGERRSGPFRRVERFKATDHGIVYSALGMDGMPLAVCGQETFPCPHEACGDISFVFGKPLYPILTTCGNFALMHGAKILAHEKYMIWDGAFVKGKKFYFTGVADQNMDGGEFQAVWDLDRSCRFEALGKMTVIQDKPVFGAMHKGYCFDVCGVNQTYTEKGFLACHLAGDPVRIVHCREGERVGWHGELGPCWDTVVRESLGISGKSLVYWAVDSLGYDYAVVDKRPFLVPDGVTRHADAIALAFGQPLYTGSFTVRGQGTAYDYRLVVVCGREIFWRHSDVYGLEFVHDRISFLTAFQNHILRVHRKIQ